MIVLDTSAVSAVMRRAPDALARLGAMRPSEVWLSSPVAAEIRYGLERLEGGSRRRRNLTAEYDLLRAAVRWSDWTEAAAAEFGRQKARLESTGRLVDDMDIVIGSIALVLGARVATLNARHFDRIQGLKVDNWSA